MISHVPFTECLNLASLTGVEAALPALVDELMLDDCNCQNNESLLMTVLLLLLTNWLCLTFLALGRSQSSEAMPNFGMPNVT